MVEYWISTKKHYCEVCKIWMSGHPYNVKTHETTPKHLTAMRNAIIDSHKREKERRKAEEFEKEELERIEKLVNGDTSATVIIDDPPPSTQSFNPIATRPPTRQEEIKRLEEFYSKFSGASSDVVPTPPPAQVDPELEKKIESFLGTDWKKKFDPIKKVKYFHNLKTDQIKLINHDLINSYKKSIAQPSQPDTSSTSTTFVENKVVSSHIAKNEVIESNPSIVTQKPTIAINIKSKPQLEENNGDTANPDISQTNPQYSAPIIGEWEVVSPEESAFNLPIYTEDKEQPQSESEESTYSDYMEELPKSKFAKPISNSNKSITFARRDVSVIKRQKKMDDTINIQIKHEQTV